MGGCEAVAPALCLPEWIEYRVHANGFDLENLGHEFAEAAFGIALFLEPGEVFAGQVHDRHSGRWVGLDAEFAEGNPGLSDLLKQVAEILAVDLGEVGHVLGGSVASGFWLVKSVRAGINQDFLTFRFDELR